MDASRRALSILSLALVLTGAGSAQQITSLNATSLTKSGRLVVTGSGFGTNGDQGILMIGGNQAIVTTWTDTAVVGYIPESAIVGSNTVKVIAEGISSNTVNVNVTNRPVLSGRVKWTFEADDPYMMARPKTAPDGTVYCLGIYGNLYALTPEGGLKWVRPGNGGSAISVGADGTVYAGGGWINAWDPFGNLKWSAPTYGGTMVGPNVGPDGNIYGASNSWYDAGALGAYVLSPQGKLIASYPGFQQRAGNYAREVEFGSGQWYFCNQATGFTQPIPYGIYAFGLGGTTKKWNGPDGGEQVAVGPDGTITVNQGTPNNLNNFNPDGSIKWQISLNTFGANIPGPISRGTDGTVYFSTGQGKAFAVTAAGQIKWSSGFIWAGSVTPTPGTGPVLMGAQPDWSLPAYIYAYTQAGQFAWSVQLPTQAGSHMAVYTRFGFSPDASTAYVGTTGNNYVPNPSCLLYALNTGASNSTATLNGLSFNPSTVKGGQSSTGTVTLSSAAPKGGASVTLSDNTSAITTPASVLVPEGQNSATFTLSTTTVTLPQTAQVTATYGGKIINTPFYIEVATVAPELSGFAIDPLSVMGGNNLVGTVSLSGPSSTDAVVTLSDNTTYLTTPASVVVPAGSTQASFTITSGYVTTLNTRTVTAAYNGVSKAVNVTLTPTSQVSSVGLAPATVSGGSSSTGTVTLNGPAPVGGLTISLASSSPSAVVPSSVKVMAGATSANFNIQTSAVASLTSATITASKLGVSKTGLLTIQPASGFNLTMAPSTVMGGSKTIGTVNLGSTSAVSRTVTLTDNSSYLTTPASVVVPAGASSATFTVGTAYVTSTATRTVTATFGGTSKSASVTITPTSQVTSLVISPTTVKGGVGAVGTVTLNAPAPDTGLTLLLTSSNSAAVVPSSVKVPAGATSATFSISTKVVASNTSATITAGKLGINKSAVLTVTP
jgi:hypothetical protein